MAVINVPITKAKTTLSVDVDSLPEDVFAEVVLQGLKTLLNRGASKITKAAFDGDEDAMKAEALKVGEAQLELVMSGKIKFTGGKAKKASGKVMTEARRIAKALVKDALKRNGEKPSHYEASDITKAANALLDTEQGAEIIAQAQANIEEQSKVPVSIDIGGLIKASPKLVEKAEAAKAKKKAQLSATQAGIPAKRKKGPPQANA